MHCHAVVGAAATGFGCVPGHAPRLLATRTPRERPTMMLGARTLPRPTAGAHKPEWVPHPPLPLLPRHEQAHAHTCRMHPTHQPRRCDCCGASTGAPRPARHTRELLSPQSPGQVRWDLRMRCHSAPHHTHTHAAGSQQQVAHGGCCCAGRLGGSSHAPPVGKKEGVRHSGFPSHH
jgi:hypothetical protein